ncbi:MAG: ImmA/IrrE family metallo-endopeptidase [Bacteroidales bacterium]|nr:ImmA/IrrE family metallo-endopeptidase [Bacteroidales bacterium]
MSKRIKNINRDVIEWAIIRNGNSLEEFYAHNPDVESWTKGEKYPTLKQLENFTHKVHVPFGYMFLDNPPVETIPLPFFRTGQKAQTEKVSLNVFHAIQLIKDRQDWLTEYLEELDFSDLNFVGKFSVKDNASSIVSDIREVLQLEEDWAELYENWEQALNHLTSKIEEAGIIVTFNGIVGANTHRVIDVNECRGFVLVNKKAPFLFINAADAKAAQMFTLIHELAHVWIGESAGFDNQQLLPANNPMEILCDKVAAEFLVPKECFLQKWELTQDFKSLSKMFKVSPIVIYRRALDLKLINLSEFLRFYNNYMSDFKQRKEKQGSGGDFYATARKRVSVRFAVFVDNAVKENKLLYRDAYKLTNMKGDTYNKFITEHLY